MVGVPHGRAGSGGPPAPAATAGLDRGAHPGRATGPADLAAAGRRDRAALAGPVRRGRGRPATGALRALGGQLDPGLPHYLPVGGTAALRPAGSARPADGPPRDLPALLSQALLAYTAEFERASPLPLPIIRNALRVVSEPGVRVRDLPGLAGVAREAIAVFLRELESRGCVVIGPGPARLARLTAKGRAAQDAAGDLGGRIDQEWQERFGADVIGELTGAAQDLWAAGGPGQPRLASGLRPYPDGWRAHPPYLAQTTALLQDPGGTLPHYPVVSHRGGFPDGS